MARVSITGSFKESFPIEAHEIIHGNVFPLIVTVRDEAGAAIDLTGWTTETACDFHLVDAEARRPGVDGMVALSLTNFASTEDPPRNLTSSVSDAAAGEVSVDLPGDLAPINPAVDASRTICAILYVQRIQAARKLTTRVLVLFRRGPP